MLMKIILAVSMCSHTNLADVAKKQMELQKQYPQAKVTVSIDKKCMQPETYKFSE